MASQVRQPDGSDLQAQVFAIARDLLDELGSSHAVCGSAHLDRDLGLGSLERVELLVRLDRFFGTSLPEHVIAEADTLDEVIAALTKARGVARTAQPDRSAAQPFDVHLPGRAERAAELASAQTWQDVLRYRAGTDATRPHLILWEEGGEAQRVSFGELHEGARAVSARLAGLEIRRGDAVALMLPTSRDFFVTFAGVLLAGAVPVPIYPPVRADRIAEYAERQSAILCNAEARLLITFQEAERVAKLLRPRVPSLRGIVTPQTLLADESAPRVAQPRTPVAASSSDLALLQYTSGSTGNPKGVQLTHANLLANVRAIGEALAIQPDDVGVSWLPLYHDMGLIGAWLMPLYFGLPVVVLSPIAFLTRPDRWLWALHRHRATLTAAPNFAYELAVRKVADEDIEGLDLSSMRAALNGAEPVDAGTLDRFSSRFARYAFRREALMPVYGLAEASLAVTVPPLGRGPLVDNVERDAFTREGRAVPAPPALAENDASILSFVSVGRPVPDHDVRIVDAAGHDLGDRLEGALWFRGPSTTSGYFHNEDASHALFPEGCAAGWLTSGDRAYRAGGELFITGREKDIIIKAGHNLYPHEIEEIAGRVAGVRKGCVVAFGTRDMVSGTERLVVVAETRERAEPNRQRIARAIVDQVSLGIGVPPDVVELLPPHGVPKTSSGKLQRDRTRRLYLAGSLGSAVPPPWVQVARLACANGLRTLLRAPRRVLELFYGVYALLLFAVWIVPVWIVVSVAPSRRAAGRITSSALRAYLALAGCSVCVRGREHLTASCSRVFVSNHASYSDVLILMAALGADYHFVAKSEVRNMPLIGTFLRKLDHFAFDRSDPRSRLQQAEQIEAALSRGESVFLFPEGTFTPQPGIRPFHLGAFKAAVQTRRPIVPVALRGTRQLLRDGSYLPRPARITLTVCPRLDPASVTGPAEWKEIVRLRDASRELIGRHSGEPLL